MTIDNNNCILVEFVNEESTIQTGFLEWVEDEDKKKIHDIIASQTVVTINWPDVDT